MKITKKHLSDTVMAVTFLMGVYNLSTGESVLGILSIALCAVYVIVSARTTR